MLAKVRFPTESQLQIVDAACPLRAIRDHVAAQKSKPARRKNQPANRPPLWCPQSSPKVPAANKVRAGAFNRLRGWI